MDFCQIEVDALKENPWNPNVVDPINQEKLERSLQQDGLQNPIIVRTLDDGTLQVLSGWHRTLAARKLGWEQIQCINVGTIDDAIAKKAVLIGNSRFGDDDPTLMASLLSSDDISAEDLLSTLPFDEDALTAIFSHEGINLDDLELDNEEIDLEIDISESTSKKTHQIMRFKVSFDDAIAISDLIAKTKKEQGFSESDDLTNAGDALVYLFGKLREDDES